MAILIDEAVWPWRGERWAHLVSDHSITELHEFSRKLRVRRLSFSGDHYDVTAAIRERAVGLGAAPTSSREIVRRLRVSGLRRRNVGRWQQVDAVAVEDLTRRLAALVPPAAAVQLEAVSAHVLAAEPTSDARIVTRGDEVVAAVTTRHETEPQVGDAFELRVTPADGAWFTELVSDPGATAHPMPHN